MSWWTFLYWLNAHRVGCSFEHPFKAVKYTEKLIRCGVQLEKRIGRLCGQQQKEREMSRRGEKRVLGEKRGSCGGA